MDEPSLIERNVEATHLWLKEIDREMGAGQDRRYAYRALRSVLHALRDSLGVEQAAHLASQLPTLIRGIYYEDWKPSRTPVPARDSAEFLRRIAEDGGFAGETEASYAVTAVTTVLREHVDPGEIEDLIAVLPATLKPLAE